MVLLPLRDILFTHHFLHEDVAKPAKCGHRAAVSEVQHGLRGGPQQSLCPSGKRESRGMEKRRLCSIGSHVTTLAVLNIPPHYTQERLLNFLWVPDGSFDFVCLPFGRGYAIINFTTNEAAAAFVEKWQGRLCSSRQKSRSTSTSPEGLNIIPASVQGFKAQLERIGIGILEVTVERDSLPAIFCGTRRLDTHSELLKASSAPSGCAGIGVAACDFA
mmetsp:Transcript_2148/g.4882  ORF Transcript_2148/g.4882 Transcript_2148/m.4882 type:complete len:217 (-) Transcript_2148:184-834(-)